MAKKLVKFKSLKDRIIAAAEDICFEIPNPEKGNTGNLFFDLLVWQTLCKLSADKLKEAWAVLQQENGLVPNDDDMRARGQGEHIIAETKKFSIVATVTKGRANFDAKSFALAAAEKWNCKPEDVLLLMLAHKPEGSPTLSKRVLEAS